MTQDSQKYSQVIALCIKLGSDDDKKITKTKLAKLVYLADFAKYYYELESISNFTYKKLPQGPVTIEYFSLLDEMIENDLIKEEQKNSGSKKIILISLKGEFPNDLLDAKDIEYIEKVCLKWRGRRTEDIVNFTHNQVPWKMSFKSQEIPYSLIIQEEPENVF